MAKNTWRRNNSCSQWGEAACTWGQAFFLLGESGGCWIFVVLSLFLWDCHCGSHPVPNEFSKTRKEFPTYSYNFLALTIFMGSPHPDSHHHLQHFATTINSFPLIHPWSSSNQCWVGKWQWLVNVFNYPFNFSTQLINIYDLPSLYFTQLTYIWGLPLPKRG